MAKSVLLGPGGTSILLSGSDGFLLSESSLMAVPTLLTNNPSFIPNTPGQTIADFGNVTDDMVVTFTPNDGRLAISADKQHLVQGLSAATPGTTIDVVVTFAVPGASNSPQSLSFSVTVRQATIVTSATYNPSLWQQPIVGSPSAGAVMTPSFAATSGSDIVAFNIQCPPDATLAQRYDTMGHFFRQGHVQPSDWIEVFYSGSAKPVQMDVKTTHSDGSVKFAGMTFLFPGQNPGDVVQAKFRKSGTAPGQALSVNNNPLPAYTANLNTLGGSWDVSVGTMLGGFKQSGTWFNGPLCRCERAERYIGQAVRVVLDVYRYADGNAKLRWQFLADVNLWAGNGDNGWNFDANISRSGNTLFAYNGATFQGFGFTKIIHTGNSDAYNQRAEVPEHNIQFNPAYLINAGGLPMPYTLEYGLLASKLDELASIQTETWWRKPHQLNGIQKDMGATSDERQDLGYLNGWSVAYYVTGDYRMRRATIAVSEATLSLPISSWNNATKTPLNLSEELGFPNIWYDQQQRDGGGNPPNFKNPAPSWKVEDRIWELAHQPCLGYPAYLATAERFHWDMTHQAAQASQINSWNAIRWRPVGGVWKPWSMVTDYQVRGAGWRMRDWGLAYHICPDNDPLRPFYAQYTRWNMDFLAEYLPGIKAKQGAAFGWGEWFAAEYVPQIKFWMNDHYFAGMHSLWLAGEPKVKDVIMSFHAPMMRWRDGTDIGMGIKRGSSYQHYVGYDLEESNSANWSKKTPAEILACGDDFYGWGNGPTLWLRSLSLLYTMTADNTILTTVSRILADAYAVDATEARKNWRHMSRPFQKA